MLGGNRMNLRTYVTMSATAMLLLGGCIIVGDPNANGGAGGTGGEGVGNRGNNGGNGGGVSTGGNGGAGVGGTAGMGMGGKGGSGGTAGMGGMGMGGMGMGGSGGGPMCAMTCGQALADGVEVCAENTASRTLYDNLNMCTCVNTATSTPPGCKEKCDANLCTTGTPDQACQDCVGDSVNGCGVAFAACSNDA